MIKNIIFDMGGIILPMNSIEEPIRRFMKLGMKEEQCRELFGLNGQQGIFRQVEAGLLSPDEFLVEYKALTGYAATFDDITWAWRGFVQDAPVERLHNLDTLRSLYHLVLLSNTNLFLNAWCCSPSFRSDGRPVQDYFHEAYMSYELGGCKPDPEVFKKVLKRSNLVPEETVFLDDGRANVESARNLGIHALYIADNQDWMPILLSYLNELK